MGNNEKRIAIIGGGAAGLMVAASLIERDRSLYDTNDTDVNTIPQPYKIHIFEKNKELGTKIRISGGGRCNVTTGFFKKQDLQHKYTRGRDFLSHAMGQFGPRKMLQRCESHGVPLKCEPDMRVFPVSNKSTDIVAMFQRILDSGKCTIHFEEGILAISPRPVSLDNNQRISQDNESGSNSSINTGFTLTSDKGTYTFDSVVITTGGNAYAHTGSSGDGYTLAQSLGHSVTALGPSLNSFLLQEEWAKACSGISFQNASLRSQADLSRPVSLHTNQENSQDVQGLNGLNQRPVSPLSAPKTVTGPILFTHFGISGPLTFSYSSQIPHIPISQKEPHIALLQPFADRNEQRWNERLTQQALDQPKRQLSTILHNEFSDRRIQSFLGFYNFQGSVSIGNFPREEKKALAKLLGHGIPLTFIARRPGDEFVTAGGVNTDEVNPKTMESKLCPGLFFAGEVLNVDAVTGGFNFQACWATGRCAGENI